MFYFRFLNADTRSFDWLIDLILRLVYRSIDWLMDWLIDWLVYLLWISSQFSVPIRHGKQTSTKSAPSSEAPALPTTPWPKGRRIIRRITSVASNSVRSSSTWWSADFAPTISTTGYDLVVITGFFSSSNRHPCMDTKTVLFPSVISISATGTSKHRVEHPSRHALCGVILWSGHAAQSTGHHAGNRWQTFCG